MNWHCIGILITERCHTEALIDPLVALCQSSRGQAMQFWYASLWIKIELILLNWLDHRVLYISLSWMLFIKHYSKLAFTLNWDSLRWSCYGVNKCHIIAECWRKKEIRTNIRKMRANNAIQVANESISERNAIKQIRLIYQIEVWGTYCSASLSSNQILLSHCHLWILNKAKKYKIHATKKLHASFHFERDFPDREYFYNLIFYSWAWNKNKNLIHCMCGVICSACSGISDSLFWALYEHVTGHVKQSIARRFRECKFGT